VIIENKLHSPDSSGNPFLVSLKKKRLQRIAGGFVLRKGNRSAPKYKN
jgi:hypothetical protein